MRAKRLGLALVTTSCLALAAHPAAAPAGELSGMVFNCGAAGTFIGDKTGSTATSATGAVVRFGSGARKGTTVTCTYSPSAGHLYTITGALAEPKR